MQDKIIAQLLEQNQQLQALANNEEWDIFSEQIGAYLAQMQKLCQGEIPQEPDAFTAQHLTTLLAEDAQLRALIQSRLSLLSEDMSAKRKSRNSSRAYNAV